MTEPRDYCSPPFSWWCWLTVIGVVVFLAWLFSR